MTTTTTTTTTTITTTTVVALMTDDEIARLGASLPDAGFGALRCERGLLPLAAMDVDIQVMGVMAAIELAQSFVNTTGTAIEATYVFPLPDRAAVHRFRMEIGARVIEGRVDERGAARASYDAAIAAGHRAAIAEEDRAGVFALRVGNLMPGERAIVRLSLVGPLVVDDGEVTLRFPLVVAPRYMPGVALAGEQAGLGVEPDTTLVPDASRISPPVRVPGLPNPVRLGLRVLGAGAGATASLHAVIDRDGAIALAPGERLDRDFLLRWRLAGDELASALVVAADAGGEGGTFALTLVPPPTAALGGRPRDLVFVIDRSGSMEGWKMVAARRAAGRMIDSLTARDRFCAIAFDNDVEVIGGHGLEPATDRARFRAVEALAKIEARGGTEMLAPLTRALALLAPAPGDGVRERAVVLVTDGQVGDEDHLLRAVAPALAGARVFALGIDQAVNGAFLRRLASAGGGLCELVESEDRLDDVMAKVHRRIGTPVVTDLAIAATGLELERASLAPTTPGGKLPDVYAGSPVTIFGRYRGAAPATATIELRGTSFGEPFARAIGRAGATAGGRALAASWARALIRDLEDRYAIASDAALERRIVATSVAHGVLSRFTAYVAVDREQVVNPGGHLAQAVQPVEAPRGWAATGGAVAAGPPMSPMSSMPRGRAVAASAAMPARVSTVIASMPPPPAAAAPMAPPAFAAAPQGYHDRSAPEAFADDADELALGGALAAPAMDKKEAEERSRDRAAPAFEPAPAPTATPYHATLAAIARELEQQVHGRRDLAMIRVLRQRLVELVEDARSVGGLEAFAAAVEALATRLATALRAPTADPTELLAIAVALLAVAHGSTPAPAPTSARSFWK